MLRIAAVAAAATLSFAVAHRVEHAGLDAISPNDNRHAAGTLTGNVLSVALETRRGVWKPEGENGRTLEVAAFAEVGKPLTAPGPMIRVRSGTAVRVSVRNNFDKPLWVY